MNVRDKRRQAASTSWHFTLYEWRDNIWLVFLHPRFKEEQPWFKNDNHNFQIFSKYNLQIYFGRKPMQKLFPTNQSIPYENENQIRYNGTKIKLISEENYLNYLHNPVISYQWLFCLRKLKPNLKPKVWQFRVSF